MPAGRGRTLSSFGQAFTPLAITGSTLIVSVTGEILLAGSQVQDVSGPGSYVPSTDAEGSHVPEIEKKGSTG